MATQFEKVKLPIAQSKRTHLDLSGTHITSANFLELNPVYYRHMIPGEKLSVNAQAITRLAPLAVPTFGRARLNLRAFFVPFRTVMPNFNDFIVDTVASNSSASAIPQSVPVIANNDLVSFFTTTNIIIGPGSGTALALSQVAQGSTYDFTTYGVDPNNPGQFISVNRVFTTVGRRWYKILRSLGYQINWNESDTTEYSALALLSYAKVYYDWYAASAYLDTNAMTRLAQMFNYDIPSGYKKLNLTDLLHIAELTMAVVYDGDYLTSAWDNPVSPANGNFSAYSMDDITVNDGGNLSSFVVNSDNSYFPNPDSTPVIRGKSSSGSTSASPSQLSQYVLDTLRALTNYQTRHRLVGARNCDRLLAEYGINLDAAKLDRSIYLGNNSIDIKIGDVMSTTHGSGSESQLGDYAGKGFGAGEKNFEYTCDEFGLFIITASILPSAGTVQGFDRNNLHLSRLDFFTNEFDALGCQAIAKGEVLIPSDGSFYSSNSPLGVFGYTPRYSEYKKGFDLLSGNPSLPSLAGQDSWHLFRLFSYGTANDTFQDEASVVHSLDFVRGVDGDQYNRIFSYTKEDYDKFQIVYQFNVGAIAPCKSLFDSYDWHDDEGKTITMQSNGTKMN